MKYISENGASYKTKKEMVYQELKREIIEGTLLPGTKLTISEIAKKFGVSEIPVREAVQALLSESFLTNTQGSGLAVSLISEDDINQVFELRTTLEPLAARLATRYVTDEEITQMREIIIAADASFEQGDVQAYIKTSNEFHRYLFSLSRNPWLIIALQDLFDYINRYISYFKAISQVPASALTHAEIISALETRDELAVEAFLRAHAIATWKKVAQCIREENLARQSENSEN